MSFCRVDLLSKRPGPSTELRFRASLTNSQQNRTAVNRRPGNDYEGKPPIFGDGSGTRRFVKCEILHPVPPPMLKQFLA